MQKNVLFNKIATGAATRHLSVVTSRGRRTCTLRATNGGESDDPDELNYLFKGTINDLIEKQRSVIQDAQNELENFDRFVAQAQDSPQPLLNFLGWLRSISESSIERETERLAKLESTRANLEQDLTQMAKEEERQKKMLQDPWYAQDLVNFAATGETAAVTATGILLQAFVGATVATWVLGSFLFHVEISTLLPGASLPSQQDFVSWSLWSLPYLGATAAAAAIRPLSVGDQGALRFTVDVTAGTGETRRDDDAFFATLSPLSLAAIAAGLGYTQAVVYQGIWLQIILKLLGAPIETSGGVVASDDVEALQRAMGSLIAAPSVAPFLWVPTGVILAAAAEAGWWWFSNAPILDSDSS